MKLQDKAYKENEAEFKEQNLPENQKDRMIMEKYQGKQEQWGGNWLCVECQRKAEEEGEEK